MRNSMFIYFGFVAHIKQWNIILREMTSYFKVKMIYETIKYKKRIKTSKYKKRIKDHPDLQELLEFT